MLHNNLDPEVAENPADLVVYGGSGKAARDWASFDAIARRLTTLRSDQTLLVQSGKPVGVLETTPDAPRVLIANGNLVGDWATWDEFRRLDELGLIMFGQMTAGSWLYIGSQGIVQGTYETFAAVARQRFGGDLGGTITVTAGLGGMGGAQPLAVTMNGGVAICLDVDPAKVARRVELGYLDTVADGPEEALRMAEEAAAARRPLSIGVCANAAEVLPAYLRSGAPIDIVTDQTSAHEPLTYLPAGEDLDGWAEKVRRDPTGCHEQAQASMAAHVEAMLGFRRGGAVAFDYGNSLRAFAAQGGCADAFEIPGFVQEYVRPLFSEGRGPFRWVALSGDRADIARTDRAVAELFPDDEGLQRWLRLAGDRVPQQGLPARICWLGHGQRDQAALAFNDLVRRGEVAAPIVVGRDHFDGGSVASPYRETEGMLDGSDAIADWPLLNALVNVASGASWVSIHHGGGVGMGKSIHSGQVCVADGTELADARLARVFRNDSATAVLRHADAGYPIARDCAARTGLEIPMGDPR
jgi:urocanate hydratase